MFLFLLCVCVCAVLAYECSTHRGQNRESDSPEVGVTGDCGSSDVVTGHQTQVLCIADRFLTSEFSLQPPSLFHFLGVF